MSFRIRQAPWHRDSGTRIAKRSSRPQVSVKCCNRSFRSNAKLARPRNRRLFETEFAACVHFRTDATSNPFRWNEPALDMIRDNGPHTVTVRPSALCRQSDKWRDCDDRTEGYRRLPVAEVTHLYTGSLVKSDQASESNLIFGHHAANSVPHTS